MIVITDRTNLGRIGEHDIYKVKDYKVLPLSHNKSALTQAQVSQMSLPGK
jgi:hypothetical protein